jgi:hypothetical protein
VTGRVRRWYRIAAAMTSGVALAALVLGASGQLFAPAVAPSTAKAVLAQEAGAQNPGPQAPADDAPRRCARSGRTSRRPHPRTRLRAGCQPARVTPCRVTGTGSA